MKLKILNVLLSFAILSVMGCEPTPRYVYEDWDVDADERIGEEEFYTTWNDAGYYKTWDTDGDGFIDEVEWEAGTNEYYPDWDYDQYGYYTDWDIDDDEILGEDEFAEGQFTLWDTDGDGFVEVTEYEEWYYDI